MEPIGSKTGEEYLVTVFYSMTCWNVEVLINWRY